jgi:hypothetical protein
VIEVTLIKGAKPWYFNQYFVRIKSTRLEKTTNKRSVDFMNKTGPVTSDWLIGDIRELGTEANQVMDKVFGPGCFGCPNSRTKTIEFGATVHGKDVTTVLKELNQVLGRS